MSDYERFRDLLAPLDPKITEVASSSYYQDLYEDASFVIELAEGVGYSGFCVQFYFDKSGALLGHGVWE